MPDRATSLEDAAPHARRKAGGKTGDPWVDWFNDRLAAMGLDPKAVAGQLLRSTSTVEKWRLAGPFGRFPSSTVISHLAPLLGVNELEMRRHIGAARIARGVVVVHDADHVADLAPLVSA
jgi:hypothetical protein